MLERIPIKSAEEIALMREVCRVTSEILDAVADIIEPGISTDDINEFVHQKTMEADSVPAPLNYRGFPKSVCTSVNDVICHGIPDTCVTLKAGDIINVDVTSIKNGFHGDSSRMYFVGGRKVCDDPAVELVETARKAMYKGIEQVKPGNRVGDIGAAIEKFIKSTGRNYGIVREYTGHGLGRSFHEAPQVLHVGKWNTGPRMKPGMTFTIEPMINQGTHETSLSRVDGWTVRTMDGRLSAQWEHSVLVTRDGYEVLTASKKELAGLA